MEKKWRVETTHEPLRIKNGKRILFANVPADGHFNPLTGLASYLQSIGYEVRWYSTSIFADKIKKMGIYYYPFKQARDINGDNIDEMLPQRLLLKSSLKKLNYDMEHFFIRRSVEYYTDITEIYAHFPFDLMISDSMFMGIPFIKEKLNVPVMSIGISPLIEMSKDLPPPGLAMTPAKNIFGKMIHAVLRTVATKLIFRKPNRLYKTILSENGIGDDDSDLPNILVRKSNLFLQIGSPSFEYERTDLGENIRFIGALAPHISNKAREPWFNDKLTQYEKVILVTQGTLEKNPEKILVPALEAFKNTEHLLVVTTGGSQTEELRKRYPQQNIIIEDFIPFGDIMPYADAYISNGGYGGVMLSIQNQLPMVVAGIDEGKNEINTRIGYFELGIDLKTQWPKPAQLKKAIEKIFTSNSYRKNVIRLSDELDLYDSHALCADYAKQLIEEQRSHFDTGVYLRWKKRWKINFFHRRGAENAEGAVSKVI